MHLDPMLAFVASARDLLPYLAAIFITIIAITFLRVTRTLTARKAPAQPAPAEAQAIPVVMVEEILAPQIVAVIAAAVATSVGPAHRVVSIRHQVNLWEKVGRQSVLTSHRLR